MLRRTWQFLIFVVQSFRWFNGFCNYIIPQNETPGTTFLVCQASFSLLGLQQPLCCWVLIGFDVVLWTLFRWSHRPICVPAAALSAFRAVIRLCALHYNKNKNRNTPRFPRSITVLVGADGGTWRRTRAFSAAQWFAKNPDYARFEKHDIILICTDFYRFFVKIRTK